MTKDIRYLTMSDIHFGHPVNKAGMIRSNLDSFFEYYSSILSKIDILFLDGDIFHTILNADSKDYVIAMTWLTHTAVNCSKAGVRLRILKGTDSHDASQLAVFDEVMKKLNMEIDYKYINTVYLEYMSDLDLNVIYIPDNANDNDAAATLTQVKKMLSDNHIDKADIAHVHGSFNYQYKGLDLPYTHDEREYLDLVDRFISFGHEHTGTTYERVIGQGSFDRLAHGEEEDKGAMFFKLSKHSKDRDEFLFLVNRNAMIFKTVDILTHDAGEAVEQMQKATTGLPDRSNIRIRMSSGNPLNGVSKDIFRKFPQFRCKTDILDKKKKQDMTMSTLALPDTLLHSITKTNIEDLVVSDMRDNNIDVDVAKAAVKELLEIVSSV